MNNENATKTFLPEFPLSVGNSPFNVKLLDMREKNLAFMKPVTSQDIYDGATNNFHPEGLFSTEIFGRVGSEERTRKFSYITLNTKILHPFIWMTIGRLRSSLIEIATGRRYATWDPESKMFVNATELDGRTGYDFFMSHVHELVFPRTKSHSRDILIANLEKFKGKGDIVTLLPVWPAGLRDVTVDRNGRVTKDEVNDFYMRALAIANTIVVDAKASTPAIYDSARTSMQNTVNQLYMYFEEMCQGKTGMFQKAWGSRAIFNGTRNVITAMNTSTIDLDSPRTPSPLYTQLGLYQLIKGCLPVAKYHLRAGWLSHVFVEGVAGAYLVNPKTLKRELVDVSMDEVDRWTTDEGLDKVITKFSKDEIRQKPIVVAGHYIGLIYIDDDSFKIFGDIDELPKTLDRKKVYPLTYCQLLYLSGYKEWNKLVVMVTRYPVSGLGSTITTYVYARTTIEARQKWERGFDWSEDREGDGAIEFPDLAEDAPFLNSLVVHSSYLSGLDADFDGDTASANILYGDLSLKENDNYFHTTNAFLDPNGEFSITPNIHTVNLVLHNMTGFQ